MSRTRFHRYVGLPDPKAEVSARLAPVMTTLRDWAVRFHPAREEFWAITRAQAALNDLARALTGEPLSHPAGQHGGGFRRPKPPDEGA